jgi:hypothetical protein
MGGGPTTKTETRRRAPSGLRRGLPEGDGEGGGGEPLPDFCEVAQEISFEVLDPARVEVGLRVHLSLQHLPLVMAGSHSIGFVPEPGATAMRGCLVEGFRMSGRVDAFDPATSRGELTIKGSNAGG